MGWLETLGIAVGIAVLIVVVVCLVCLACTLGEWLSHQSSWTSRMKFKQWLELYSLNPKGWYLDGTPNRYVWGRFGKSSYWAYVRFSFPDYLRYQAWRKDGKRREVDAQRDKRLKDILELAQSDIERLKQQADWEMEEAKRQVEETSRRVSETTHISSNGAGLPTSEDISHAVDPYYSPWFR